MPARDIVDMATREGARVLGLSDQIGTLEVGKKADIVRVSLTSPRFTPLYDIYASLVFAALPTDVTDVMVDGNWILRDSDMLHVDRTKIMRDANQVAETFAKKIDLGNPKAN
jgi:cytosine/adenosine deaminase-related metal-dependent hydrolase